MQLYCCTERQCHKCAPKCVQKETEETHAVLQADTCSGHREERCLAGLNRADAATGDQR